MRNLITKIVALILIGFFLATSNASNERINEEKEKVLSNLVVQVLGAYHFNPVKINDEFSEKAFDQYIKRLDFGKRFFIRKDIKELEKYKTDIDDQIKSGSLNFFDRSYELINKRLNQAEKYCYEILSEPFDFTKDEVIQTDFEKKSYARDRIELKKNWRKYLKYRTLVRLERKFEHQEENKEAGKKSLETLKKEARKKVLENIKSWFHRMGKMEEQDRFVLFLNSLTNIYDPHTGYYPPKDKEDFDIAMSGQLEGIGATLRQKDGYIKVVRIIPGSASWRQGELEAGDIILKVAQENKDPVNVVDMRLDKAVQLIRGKKGTHVYLTIKKMDGTINEISITRDVVVIEETHAKSAILENKKTDIRSGYISLPRFYADFNNTGAKNVTSDVKNAVEKLKEKNINGLILDLRGNGGGSLKDVVDIVGLFIDQGPVVQVKGRKGKPYILNDNHQGILYKGPLLVLVDAHSASASEIFAAAIQNYNRGIVIGGNRTFGKGTVQRFVKLDNYLANKFSQYKPLGSVKLTTQKFYRINGGATQLKGVKPGIVLPDKFMFIEKTGEKELDYPLPWDKINPVEYQSWTKLPDNLDPLREEASGRVSENEVFQMIRKKAQYLQNQRDKTIFSLNWEEFHQFKSRQEKQSRKFNNIRKKIPGMDIVPVKPNLEKAKTDTVVQARVKNFTQKLQKDVHVFETLRILDDLNELTKADSRR